MEMFECCRTSDLEAVRKIILSSTDVNISDSGGRTLLHFACGYNHLNVVKFLIAGDLEAVCSKKLTLLHVCCTKGHSEIVFKLLRHE